MKTFVQVTEKTIVKGIILLLILSVTLAVITAIGIQMPYHAYETYINEGIDGNLYRGPRPDKDLIRGRIVKIQDDFDLDAEKLWVNLEFTNFIVPFPLEHPVFKVNPKPIYENKKSIARLDYIDGKFNKLLSFVPLDTQKGDFSFPKDKLFKLPLVKKYILKKGKAVIWKDLFTKNLDFKPISIINFSAFKKMLKDTSPLELSYFLYLYKLRERVFPKDAIAANIIDGGHIVFEIEAPQLEGTSDGSQKYYIGRVLDSGKFYSYKIELAKDNNYSNLIIRRIMKSLKVQISNESQTSQKLYSEFRGLPYKKRIGHTGLIYLYSAWTHEMDNKAFMRELIQFLERGNEPERLLMPFYKFSRSRFGTTLSTRDRFLEEDAQNRLQRNIDREKLAEERALEGIEFKDSFKSSKEEIDYKLRRAKAKNQKERDAVLKED